jgi:CheY-like chemotaxis protein
VALIRGDEVTAVHHPARRSADPKLTGRPLVLVAHISPSARQALLVTLDLLGFDVLVAGDEVTALALLADLQPHVVVIDPVLWSTAGDHLLERLHADDTAGRTPIIVFGRSAAQPRATTFSVNGVHHLRSEDGVSRLVDLLYQLNHAGCSGHGPGGDGAAA